MRELKHIKPIVLRVSVPVYSFIKGEAEKENITITEKARQYLTKAMEKEKANS